MSPNNTPTLTGLPQELFDAVISHVKDRADLSSLSRTSKALRSATIELVFKNVTMLWTGDEEVKKWEPNALQKVEYLRLQNPNTIETSPGCECPRLDLLLRSILETPKHGEYVRKLDLQCVQCRYYHEPKQPELPAPPNSEDYHSLIKTAMRRTGLDQSGIEEEIEADLKRNGFNAVVGLLILLCPNITSLALGLDIIKRNTILQLILQDYALPSEISCSLSRLQYLEDVRIGTSFESGAMIHLVEWPWSRDMSDLILDLDSYLPLFYLPRLRRAELSLPDPRDIGFEWPAESASYSPLQILLLPNSSIPPRILHNILEYTPYVTRLEYDHWLWSCYMFEAQDLTAALVCIKDTLMHLKVGIRAWSSEDQFIGESPAVKGYCSLKELSALETVTIPACILLGWWKKDCPALADVLPANVRTVCLANDLSWFDVFEKFDVDLFPIIQEFAASEIWRNVTPRLKEFNLCYRYWQLKDELRELCDQNGWAHEVTLPEVDLTY